MVFERECAERYHEHVRQAQMKSERDVEQEEMLRWLKRKFGLPA